MQKCECSENWKRDFIKYFSMTAIGVIVVLLVLVFVERLASLPQGLKMIVSLLRSVYFVAFVVFLGVLFFYTRNLSKTKCECSEDKMRTIMHYFGAILGGFYIFAAIFALIGMIITGVAIQRV